MSKIIVEAPAAGREVVSGVIAVNPNNTDFGSIMLSQTAFSVNDSGFMNQERRVSFISGEVAKLEAFVDAYKLAPGCDYSKATGTPWKLVIKEQTTPFFEGQTAKINPKTNEELCTEDGEPIYRKVVLATEASGEADVHVTHKVTTVAATQNATRVMSAVQ